MSGYDGKNISVSSEDVRKQAETQQPSIELSGRLGFYVTVTPQELDTLRGEDLNAAQETLIQLIQSGRCEICGDTYFPYFWNRDYFDDDIEFDLPTLPLNRGPQSNRAEHEKPKLEDMMKDAKSRQSPSVPEHEKPDSDKQR